MRKGESCKTCKYYKPVPFSDMALCELSDYYHCECDGENDLCGEYAEE